MVIDRKCLKMTYWDDGETNGMPCLIFVDGIEYITPFVDHSVICYLDGTWVCVQESVETIYASL